MNQSDLDQIAGRFRKLPFAFLGENEVDLLAKDISSARTAEDLEEVISILERDIETHRDCDNWGKAEREEEVLDDLLDLDGILSLGEKAKLREIIHAKAKDFSEIRSSSIALKMPGWDAFLKERGVRRIARRRKEGEVGVNDPFGSYLVMSEETARKILAIGL